MLPRPVVTTTNTTTMNDTAKLSPAAQAVVHAYDNTPERPTGNHRYHWLSAALRAAADQVVPHMEEPDWGACDYMKCDIELYTDHQRKRAQFLAIAAELKGQHEPVLPSDAGYEAGSMWAGHGTRAELEAQP